jgi:GGDEF domain-containing protein
MVELAIRWLVAAALVGTAAFADRPEWEIAWRVAAFGAALAVVVWVLDRRELRTPGPAAVVACADALMIAAAAGSADVLAQVGWLAAVPPLLATVRHRASPIAMAPIAAASLPAADNWFQAATPLAPLYGCAAAILVAGFVADRYLSPTAIRAHEPSSTEPCESEVTVPLAFAAASFAPSAEEAEVLEPTAYVDLRDRFRRLRDSYLDLQRRSTADRVAVQIYQAAHGPGENLAQRLARATQEALGVEGLTLYSAAQMGDAMTVRAAAGDVPAVIQGLTIPLGRAAGVGQLRGRADAYLRALLDDERKAEIASVILRDGTRLLGLITLNHRVPERLIEAAERAEAVAPILATLLREGHEAEQQRRRLREGELLYTIATVAHGAETAATLAARVVRELWEILSLDHVAVHVLDGEDSIMLASQGAALRLLDLLEFGAGRGLAGWIRSGAPEVALFDVREEGRCRPEEALRRRVGSFVLQPIQTGPEAYGFLVAATHAAGGLDLAETETLRVVAAELGHAMARLEGRDARREGIATPAEFQEAVAASRGGCLVYLDPIRREEAEQTYGRPAVEHALRGFARRVRGKLPLGAMLCRRHEGDFVAYLDGYDESFARSWANEVAALASMIGLRTPDGKASIPLAIRAKVALVDRARTRASSPQVQPTGAETKSELGR